MTFSEGFFLVWYKLLGISGGDLGVYLGIFTIIMMGALFFAGVLSVVLKVIDVVVKKTKRR